jgi:hypothetical protein
VAHLIRYRNAKGSDAAHEVEELADAIAYVERLRNEDSIEGARIYRVEEVEVAFEFKPYFRVEIGSSAPATRVSLVPPPAPVVVAAAAPTPAADLDTDSEAEDDEPSLAPVWAPPAGTTADLEADRAPAHMAVGSATTVDPWAAVPAPPVQEDAVAANGSGRRGLFGR